MGARIRISTAPSCFTHLFLRQIPRLNEQLGHSFGTPFTRDRPRVGRAVGNLQAFEVEVFHAEWQAFLQPQAATPELLRLDPWSSISCGPCDDRPVTVGCWTFRTVAVLPKTPSVNTGNICTILFLCGPDNGGLGRRRGEE